MAPHYCVQNMGLMGYKLHRNETLNAWLFSLAKQTESENKKVITNLCDVNRDAYLLDCGCGDCSFTNDVARHITTNRIYGFEIDDKYFVLENNVIMQRADLNMVFPADDNTFDVVIANQIFEHLYHTDLFIKEIYRVLKVGGYAIISSPNLASWHNIVSLLLGWQPFEAHLSDEVGVGNPLSLTSGSVYEDRHTHLRVPTHKSLSDICRYYGFTIEARRSVGYLPFTYPFARFLSWIDGVHSIYVTIKVRKNILEGIDDN